MCNIVISNSVLKHQKNPLFITPAERQGVVLWFCVHMGQQLHAHYRQDLLIEQAAADVCSGIRTEAGKSRSVRHRRFQMS